MFRSILTTAALILAAAAPVSGADGMPTTAPATTPSPTASFVLPFADELPTGGFDAFEGPLTIVSLGLYSGRPDPSWELSTEEAAALVELLDRLPRVDGSPPTGGLGYHGFVILQLTPDGLPRSLVAFDGTVAEPFSRPGSYLHDPGRSVERFLLDRGRDQLSAAEIMATGLDPEPTQVQPSAEP